MPFARLDAIPNQESRFTQSMKSFHSDRESFFPEYDVVSPNIYFILFCSKGVFLTDC